MGQGSRHRRPPGAQLGTKSKYPPMTSRENRNDQLLESALVLSADLPLQVVLQRIIELAVNLTGARYGALGVVGSDGRLRDFITTGITPEERQAIGPLPVG